MGLRDWLRAEGDAYRAGHERPLAGYMTLMSIYGGGVVAGTLAARRMGKQPPRGLSVWDVTQLSIATHRISRTVAKDPVTSPVRAPFTRYEGVSAAAELDEQVRGRGLRHSLGELVSCPMCLAQWVATALCGGMVFAPRATRLVASTFTCVAGSDFLQYLYAALQQKTE
jgi:hypothetical protein